jgi:hypothetical protein
MVGDRIEAGRPSGHARPNPLSTTSGDIQRLEQVFVDRGLISASMQRAEQFGESTRMLRISQISPAVSRSGRAIFSWLIGAGMSLLIDLLYAELGTMFPVSGGVIRYPVQGALQYATKYAPFTKPHEVGGETVHTLTPLGYLVAVLAMAFFVIVNYFGIRWLARVNNEQSSPQRADCGHRVGPDYSPDLRAPADRFYRRRVAGRSFARVVRPFRPARE